MAKDERKFDKLKRGSKKAKRKNRASKKREKHESALKEAGKPLIGRISGWIIGGLAARPILSILILGTLSIFAFLAAYSALNVLFNPLTWGISALMAVIITKDKKITLHEIYIYGSALGTVWFLWGAYLMQQSLSESWGFGGGIIGVILGFMSLPKAIVYSLSFMLELSILSVIFIVAVKTREKSESFKIKEIFNINKKRGRG